MPGFPDLTGRPGALIIANHISYLDVCMIGAFLPTVFITSREIEEAPILGYFAKMGGCLFVERRRRMAVLNDLNRITALLTEGVNVMVFPEGSTSDGSAFLAFKASLLESAIRCRSKVIPLCLKYRSIEGRPFDKSNADRIAWYGDMTFFPHFLALIGVRRIDASLSMLGELPFRAHKSRKKLAAAAFERISSDYFDA